MATINSLSTDILNIIEEYSSDIKKELEEKLDETASLIIDYIKNNAPRSGRSKSLADSFITKVNGSGVNKTVIIYSKDKGRIVHLLEFGFKHRNGKFVPAKPFLRPSFDYFTPKMIEDIKSIIAKGN